MADDPYVRTINNELGRWEYPEYLEGIILDSEEELRLAIPGDNTYTEIFLSMERDGFTGHGLGQMCGFDRYSRAYIKDKEVIFDVAYGCNNCREIIIGPPKITIKEETMKYACRNCSVTMKEQ